MNHETPTFTNQSGSSHHADSAQRRWYPAKSTNHWKFPILGQVTDVAGTLWNVRDVRLAKHGFDIYFGTRADDRISYVGQPQLIDTQALYDFWNSNRTKGHGFLFDLPAGRTTLKRSRRRLGFNFHDDVDDFWMDRIEDLGSLPPREFAAKHSVTVDLAFDWRTKLVGIRSRPAGWWRTADTCSLLLSKLTLREIGEQLNISISQVHRLRKQASLETSAA